MFQGPHERRGMQRKKKKKKEPTPVFWWLDPIRASPMRERCACAHTFVRCELCHNITADDWITRTAARNLGIKVCSGCILAADAWVICTEKVHEMYTEKLFVSRIFASKHAVPCGFWSSLTWCLILQTKFSRHIRKRNTVCASSPPPPRKVRLSVTWPWSALTVLSPPQTLTTSQGTTQRPSRLVFTDVAKALNA